MSTSRNQVVRMLALVPYLQSQEGIPIQQVAADFGVQAKVIERDLRLLMFCGQGQYPGELIDFDLDALEEDGVIFIRDAEFLNRPLKLMEDEAMSLIVALRTLRASSSGPETTVIDGVLAKLETLIGDGASLIGDGKAPPVDVHVETTDPEIHSRLMSALTGGKRLAISYATDSRDDQTDREVDPVRLFTSGGRVYLEAWCCRAEDIRFFRLDRILSAEVTTTDVESHDAPTKDLSEGLFIVGEATPFAILDLTPQAYWMAEYYQVEPIGEPIGDRWRVKLYGADLTWLRRLVLRSSDTVKVVEPETLVEQVVQHATLALQAYDEVV